MPKRRRNNKWPSGAIVVVAILLIVIVYIIYTISLGQIDLTPNSPKDETLAEKKEKAELEHKRLVREIANQEELKEKLRKQFRRIYLFVRLVFAGMLAGYNLLVYQETGARSLGDFLNWNELLLLAFITVNFVSYGSLANFNSFVRYVKNRIENWVYRNHPGLEDKLKKNIADAERIKKQIIATSNNP